MSEFSIYIEFPGESGTDLQGASWLISEPVNVDDEDREAFRQALSQVWADYITGGGHRIWFSDDPHSPFDLMEDEKEGEA